MACKASAQPGKIKPYVCLKVPFFLHSLGCHGVEAMCRVRLSLSGPVLHQAYTG